MRFYTLLGKSFFKIQKDLHAVYGDFCLSNGAFLKWMNSLKNIRDS